MDGHAPAGCEKQAGPGLAGSCGVLGGNVLRLAAPHQGLATRCAEHLLCQRGGAGEGAHEDHQHNTLKPL
eukprot:1146813-Pyramimonas_sp.AAC.2